MPKLKIHKPQTATIKEYHMEFTRDESRTSLYSDQYALIPDATKETILRHIYDRLEGGGFMFAVLSNNLRTAVGTADAGNSAALATIVKWLYNNAPSICWGSEEKVHNWLTKKGE